MDPNVIQPFTLLQVKEIAIEMKKYENPLMRSMAKLILKKMDKIMPTILEAKQRMRGEASSWFDRGLIEAN